MRMTGTEKSFKAWANSQGPDIYFYRNTIRERSGVYSVTVPEINLKWFGDAQDANEARILAVADYEKGVKKNPALPPSKEFWDKTRAKRHLSHDWYVAQLFKAQKVGDIGLRKSLNNDLRKMSKFHRDEIKEDFNITYKKWYDSQAAMRRATTKNPRAPKSIQDVGAGPDKAKAQMWYGHGWNAARGGALSTPPDNRYRGIYLKGYREYRPGQAPLLENPGGRFTAPQLSKLRKGYAGIKGIDPELPTYAALTAMLDTMTQPQLKQLAKARINFVSGLALNRIKRKGNPGMARKKPRTKKQLAATRKLIAFNKARRKKKPARRKTARRKIRSRKNPALPPARRRAALATAERSKSFVVFKCHGKSLMFLAYALSRGPKWVKDKQYAAGFRIKAHAEQVARKLAYKMGGPYSLGVAPTTLSSTQIKAQCGGKG